LIESKILKRKFLWPGVSLLDCQRRLCNVGYQIRTLINRKWEEMELVAHFLHLFYVMSLQVVLVQKPVEIQKGVTSAIPFLSASVTSIFLYFLCLVPSSLSLDSELSYVFVSQIKQFQT
jgi:hypothetical protein